MKMLREWSCRRHRQKSEPAIEVVGRRLNQIPIPFHHLGGFAYLVQHRPAVNGIDRMQLESKRHHDPEVPAAAANGPEQIRVLIGARLYKSSISQNQIG